MSNNNYIDDLFRSSFDRYEPTTSKELWDKIENKLSDKKKRRVLWWYWASAASIALLFSLLTYNFIGHKNKEEVVALKKNMNNKPIIKNGNKKIKNTEALSIYNKINTGNGIIKKSHTTIGSPILISPKTKTESTKTPSDISISETTQVLAEVGKIEKTSTPLEKKQSPILANKEQIAESEIKNYIKKQNEDNKYTSNSLVLTEGDFDSITIKEEIVEAIIETDTNNIFLKGIEEQKEKNKSLSSKCLLAGNFSPDYSYINSANTQIYTSQTINNNALYLSNEKITNGNSTTLTHVSNGFLSNYNETSRSQTITYFGGTYDTTINSFAGQDSIINFESQQLEQYKHLNYSTSLMLGKPISKRWIIQTGIIYRVNLGYQFIDIPALARYNIINKKIILYATTGPNLSFYLGNIKNLESIEQIRTVNYTITSGLGIGYKFTERLSLNIQPTSRLSLAKRNNLPNSFGLNTGVYYQF